MATKTNENNVLVIYNIDIDMLQALYTHFNEQGNKDQNIERI